MTGPVNWSKKYLAYEFREPSLLERSLTHKSKSSTNNERLEFLGDAVLGLVIAEALHQVRPDSDEGSLSRHRAALVRRETLADIAADISLGGRMYFGGGELRSGGHQRQSILADGLEAIFGAIYLDGGFEQVRSVILGLYARRLDNLPESEQLKDSKTRLQEALQSAGHAVPVYKVENEAGPPHARSFRVSCVVHELTIYTLGSGTSRRKAEQAAAEEALLILNDGNNGIP